MRLGCWMERVFQDPFIVIEGSKIISVAIRRKATYELECNGNAGWNRHARSHQLAL